MVLVLRLLRLFSPVICAIHGAHEVEVNDKDIQEVLKMEDFVGAVRDGVECDEVGAALLILLAVHKHYN